MSVNTNSRMDITSAIKLGMSEIGVTPTGAEIKVMVDHVMAVINVNNADNTSVTIVDPVKSIK